jgi:hypothetical protein
METNTKPQHTPARKSPFRCACGEPGIDLNVTDYCPCCDAFLASHRAPIQTPARKAIAKATGE